MRSGQNPNRLAAGKSLNGVVLLAITHLPTLTGYHANRLEIVKACLETMRKNTGVTFGTSVMIWDNGSCPELLSWLRTDYRPDVLIESANLGKTNARAMAARMVAPGTVMSITDDDMLFAPGWLKAQMDLLNGFPGVACVTGYPVRTQFRWGCDKTKAWGQANGKVTAGKIMPREWENDFCDSIGRDPAAHERDTQADFDYLVEYKGKRAFLTSHHCQFVTVPSRTGLAFFHSPAAMQEERSFDVTMDALGLRLATVNRYVRHMGNVIDEKLRPAVVNALAGTVNPTDSLDYWQAADLHPKESVQTFG